MYSKTVGIVVIDDDTIIRNALKILIWGNLRSRDVDIKLYSSKDGVDGLGLIHASNPDIVIIDSTLPRYSGIETIESLSSIEDLVSKHVIIIHDDSVNIKNLPSGYKLISKKNKNFIFELTNYLKKIIYKDKLSHLKIQSGIRASLVGLLTSLIIKFANKGDLLMLKISNTNFLFRVFLYLYWILIQFVSSFYYSLLLLLTPNVKDSNIKQGVEDSRLFRVKTYPSLIAIFVMFFFFLFQILILFTGGIVLFNTIKIQSIFAAANSNFVLDLGNSTYDINTIEFRDNSIQLKENIVEQEILDDSEENENPVSYTVKFITYSSDRPGVTFNQGIAFDKLVSLYELSNLNINKEDSLADPSTIDSTTNVIKYQLSPDKSNWFYYGSESKWEKTTNGFESSNTIQEVNKYLSEYQNQIQGTELYLRAYLRSDGDYQIKLSSIEIERDLSIISTTDNVVSYAAVEQEVITQKVAVSENIVPVPTLFSASSLNGKKFIYGKILNTDINDSDLYKYKVEAYTTESNNTNESASNTVQFIGESQIKRNQRGELVFTIEASAQEGGFVTVKLIYKPNAGEEKTSLLSKPLNS